MLELEVNIDLEGFSVVSEQGRRDFYLVNKNWNELVHGSLRDTMIRYRADSQFGHQVTELFKGWKEVINWLTWDLHLVYFFIVVLSKQIEF